MTTLSADAVRNVYVTGLKNAHALEKEALSVMKPQIARLERYPEMAERLEAHVRETEAQVSRLDGILDRIGEVPSTLKDTGGSILGSVAAMGHTVAGDEVLKNSFANFAFENYEIAAYRSLIRVAGEAGDAAAVASLTQSLHEEEAMAGWIADHLDSVTARYLSLTASGQSAKR